MEPMVKLEKLEDSLKFIPKPVKVVIKRLILQPTIKISKKTARLCSKQSYVFVWTIKPNGEQMLIRSSGDPKLFVPVNVNMSQN